MICALTGLVIVSSIIAYPDIDYSNGAELTKMAFSKIPVIGPFILSFGLLTFAFSTILGWSYYGERAMEYIKGKRWTRAYRLLYIVAVFAGSVANLTIVWNIADCMNALMALPISYRSSVSTASSCMRPVASICGATDSTAR